MQEGSSGGGGVSQSGGGAERSGSGRSALSPGRADAVAGTSSSGGGEKRSHERKHDRRRDPSVNGRGGELDGGGHSSDKRSHERTNGHARQLNVVHSVPPPLTEAPTVITTALVQAILPPGAPPLPEASAGGQVRRQVSGILLKATASSSAAGAGSGALSSSSSGSNKRKRRPPGWLAGMEQGDDEEIYDPADEASSALLETGGSASGLLPSGSASRKRRHVAAVEASQALPRAAVRVAADNHRRRGATAHPVVDRMMPLAALRSR